MNTRTGKEEELQENDAHADDGHDGQDGAYGTAHDADDQGKGYQGVVVEQTCSADESGPADEGQERR